MSKSPPVYYVPPWGFFQHRVAAGWGGVYFWSAIDQDWSRVTAVHRTPTELTVEVRPSTRPLAHLIYRNSPFDHYTALWNWLCGAGVPGASAKAETQAVTSPPDTEATCPACYGTGFWKGFGAPCRSCK